MKTLGTLTVVLFVAALLFGISGSIGMSNVMDQVESSLTSCGLFGTGTCSPGDSSVFPRAVTDLSIAGSAAFFAMMGLLLTLHARAVRGAILDGRSRPQPPTVVQSQPGFDYPSGYPTAPLGQPRR